MQTCSNIIARIIAKNRLILPERVVEVLGNPSYFEVEIEGDRLVLTPLRPKSAGVVRRKLQTLNLLESDVTDAVAWARRKREWPPA